MTANRLMLNKQCLVPGQRPMDLIRAQSDGNETTGGCRVLGTEEPGGARCTRTAPGFTPSLHISPHNCHQAETLRQGLETGELSLSIISCLSQSNTCNYVSNGTMAPPPAWDWQPSLLWHWWIYLLAELLRSLTREPTDNSKFRDNRVNSQPALPWLLHSSEVKL